MADVRKEQERDELHRAIWAIADELRGSVDGWDFKSYVLGMMFYRYISEKMLNRLVRIWLKLRDSSFCPASFSAMSEREPQMTKI